MITYTLIQYDVTRDVMYFLGSPTPGLKTLIENNNLNNKETQQIIEGDNLAQNELVPISGSTFLINFLENDVPEINLNDAISITLKIEIIDDIEAGDVYIICKNQDKTTTYVTKGGGSWDIVYIDILKPIKKWPTLGKCKDCLNIQFATGSNAFNFYGSIGGEWTGQYINGQKEYKFLLPDYSNVSTYGNTTEYRIRWRPNASYTGTDYNGNSISFTNQKRWVATPLSQINLPLNTSSFFHVTPGDSASCPYYNDTPLTPPWYNFFGKKGYFLTALANQLPDKPCPTFSPIPGQINWGYNCNPNVGCVPSPSGSIGLYATIEECNLSCSIIDPDPIISYRCLGGDCIPIDGPGGQFATLADCIASGCENVPVEPPIIYECVEGNCYPITSGSVATGSFFATLIDCQASCSVPPVPTYEYLCTPNGCVQYPSGSLTGSFFTSLDECNAVCNLPEPTFCPCSESLNLLTNSSFSQGSTGWTFSPNPQLPGVGGWNFNTSLQAVAGVIQQFDSFNASNVYIFQPNVLNISCSYNVCFQAWTNNIDANCGVSVGTGNFSDNLAPLTTPLTTIPTAYSFTISNVETSNLTLYAGLFSALPTGSQFVKIYIDNICVTLNGCPPPPEPAPEDCYITGSAYSYVSASYDCLCPEGFTSDGSGSCVQSGSLIINAISAITSSINASPLSNVPIQGYSILQNPAGANQFIAGWNILKASGLLQPILYYDWNFNGTGDSSISNVSPFSGSSLLYNTQYTFDILSSSFWYEPNLPDNSGPGTINIGALPIRWVASLLRQAQIGNYYLPDVGSIVHFNSEDRWSGFGTTLNVPSNKTYYVGIIGQGAMQIKLDGNTILRTSPTATQSYSLNLSNYPSYFQNLYSRYGEWPNGTLNFGVLAPPLYSLNNYLPNDLTGACIDYMFQYPGVECPPQIITNGITQKLSSVFNLYIYPVTMSAGCHKINFEVNAHGTFKYCNTQQASLGAIIFDMTAAQIVSASNYNDLNILWDSTYLDAIDYNGNYNGPGKPRYMYSYDISLTPSASFYTSYCPTGSTAIGGNPCNGCQTSQSANLSIPCGNCLECTHGLLYNGYVVDKGGATLQGRGPGGIVNTGSVNASTWVIPTESDWNNLVTFLNGGTAPTNVTITGSLGTISGGKLKDYTRDLEATCWENPNIGAQTNVSSSGWAGTAGGRRKDDGTFEGLGFEGLWWSANSLSTPPVQNGSLMATRRLEHYSLDVFRDIFSKSYGCSIRLVRPATTGETNGMFIPDAYTGKNGILYDGIVINDQVWITKNLSETLYNSGAAISNTTSNTIWSSTVPTATATSCYYNNDITNANILNGNVNPSTQECYTFPTYYVYEKCDGSEFLVQPVSGSTTTIGKVLKDSNYDCWSFFGSSEGIPTYPHIYSPTNYFSGSNVIYDNCDECEAIHTIYMTFGTKNC